MALGGITSIHWFNGVLAAIPPTLWLLGKLYFFIFFYIVDPGDAAPVPV